MTRLRMLPHRLSKSLKPGRSVLFLFATRSIRIHVQPDQTAMWRNLSIGDSAVYTRVQGKNNCPLRFYLGLNLSTRLRKSNFDYFATKCYGQLSILCQFHGQLSMKWTIAIQLSILWEMYIVKTIVHSIDRLLSTDYLSTCLSPCF